MAWASRSARQDQHRIIDRLAHQLTLTLVRGGTYGVEGVETNATTRNQSQTAVIEDARIIGIVGFHGVCWDHHSTSIGYWLAESAQGRGTMTRAVQALVDHAFRVWRLHRVEIRAAVDNTRSRAIPERLGFTQEGVLRAAERIGDRYADQVVYARLNE